MQRVLGLTKARFSFLLRRLPLDFGDAKAAPGKGKSTRFEALRRCTSRRNSGGGFISAIFIAVASFRRRWRDAAFVVSASLAMTWLRRRACYRRRHLHDAPARQGESRPSAAVPCQRRSLKLRASTCRRNALSQRLGMSRHSRDSWSRYMRTKALRWIVTTWRPALLLGLVVCLALVNSGRAADEPDLIFRRSTVFKLLTPNDKLATYGLDDPDVEGVACHFTVPERGGIKGWLESPRRCRTFRLPAGKSGRSGSNRNSPRARTCFVAGGRCFSRKCRSCAAATLSVTSSSIWFIPIA